MTLPEVTKMGDSIRLYYKKSGICVWYDDIQERFGRPEAELVIDSDYGNRIFGPVVIKLLSDSDHSRIARSLSCCEGIENPEELIQQSAVLAITEYRRGDDPVQFTDVDFNYSPPGDLIDGFIPAGETTVLAAPGGSGKSYLGLGLALSVASGEPLVLETLYPMKQQGVIYCDWETGEHEQRKRVAQICKGLGLDAPPPNFYYRRMSASLPSSIRMLKKQVDELGIGLVVIDSVGFASGGEIERSDIAINFMNACKRLHPAAQLCLAHVPKASQDKKANDRDPFGSVFFREGARVTWNMQAETSEEGFVVSLFQRKNNLGRKRDKPICLEINFEETDNGRQIMRFNKSSVLKHPESAAHGPISTRILSALTYTGEAMDTREIAEAADCAIASAKTTLHRLEQSGLVSKLSDSKGGSAQVWQLVDQQSALPYKDD